jgi:predicted dehydrogenase
MVRSTFSFDMPSDPKSWLYDKELGGGGILNVGCYPTSITRLIAGAAVGKPFLNPVEVKASGKIGTTGVDLYAVGTLKFENGLVAEIVSGMGCHVPSTTTIYGSEGMLSLDNPWLPSTPCRTAEVPLPPETAFPPSYLSLKKPDESSIKRIKVEADRDLFSYEADTVAKYVEARQAPAMSWDDTLGNVRVLDSWLAEVGVKY